MFIAIQFSVKIEYRGVEILKKKIGIVVTSALVMVLGFYVYNAYQDKNNLEMDTVSYLEDKGYDSATDIEELNSVNIGEKDDIYAVVVTFKDEPMVDYFYAYKESSTQVHQIDVVNKGNNQSLKHSES